jgi:hypothetical protein
VGDSGGCSISAAGRSVLIATGYTRRTLFESEPTDAERDTDDERATEEPSEAPPEEEAEEGGAGEAHGPIGNPASDEEALANRQQEGGGEARPGEGAD